MFLFLLLLLLSSSIPILWFWVQNNSIQAIGVMAAIASIVDSLSAQARDTQGIIRMLCRSGHLSIWCSRSVASNLCRSSEKAQDRRRSAVFSWTSHKPWFNEWSLSWTWIHFNIFLILSQHLLQMLHLQKGVFTFQTAFGQPLPSCAPRAAAFLLSTISFARTLDPQRAPHRRTSVPDASSSAPAQEPNASPFGCSLQPSTQRLRSLTPPKHWWFWLVPNIFAKGSLWGHSAAAIHMLSGVAHQLQRVHFQTLLPVRQFSYSRIFQESNKWIYIWWAEILKVYMKRMEKAWEPFEVKNWRWRDLNQYS